MSRLVFNRNNGSADEYGHLLALNRILTGDVIEGLLVQANGTPNMTVVVGQGTARISTGTYPSSYGYFVGVDTTSGTPAGESVTITTAPTSNSRIDAIVGYVDLSVTPSSATANNPGMLKFAAVAGTVAASPSAPINSAIQSAIGASNPFIRLANVTVGTNVTSVSSGNISDVRAMINVSARNYARIEITSPFTASNASDQDVTGLSVTVNVPATAKFVETYFFAPQVYTTLDGSRTDLGIQEDGTDIQRNFNRTWSAANGGSGGVVVSRTKVAPSAGQHTYKIRIGTGVGSGVATVFASSVTPAYFTVQVV